MYTIVCLHVYLCTMCMPCVHIGQRASDPLELELWMAVNFWELNLGLLEDQATSSITISLSLKIPLSTLNKVYRASPV